MITFNGTTIQSVSFNDIEKTTVHFNGQEVFDEGGPTIASLSLRSIGLYTNKENRIEISNEKGYAILLIQASSNNYIGKIGVTSAVTYDSLSPKGKFFITQPLYLDNGTYFMAIRKYNGYTGGSNWGRELMTLNLSADTLDNIYSAKTICDCQYDHSPRERINGENGYTKLFFVPQEGSQSISGTIVGMAYNCVEISGLTTYKYNENWEKEVQNTYWASGFTVFPQNAEKMVDAQLTLKPKLSEIKFNVSQNALQKPRIGYLQVGAGNQDRMKWLFVQESDNVKFAFMGNSIGSVIASNTDRIRMFDLSKTNTPIKIFCRTVKNMVVFESAARKITVKDDNGNVITPTTKTEGPFRTCTYSTNVGSDYIFNFNIEAI